MQDAQELFALRTVERAVLRRIVGVFMEVRQLTARAIAGLFVGKRGKLRVALRSPREAVDAVEAEDVVYAEEVKCLGDFLSDAQWQWRHVFGKINGHIDFAVSLIRRKFITRK